MSLWPKDLTHFNVYDLVRYRVDELMELKPDGEVCGRVLMFLSEEIDKLQAKKEQP